MEACPVGRMSRQGLGGLKRMFKPNELKQDSHRTIRLLCRHQVSRCILAIVHIKAIPLLSQERLLKDRSQF